MVYFRDHGLFSCINTGEEAAAAQAVARTAQAEATKATSERDAAAKQLNELRSRLAAAERAQDRLDAVTVSFSYPYFLSSSLIVILILWLFKTTLLS